MEPFSLLGNVVGLWHKRNFLRLQRSIIAVSIVAAVFILPGAFMEGKLKVVWLEAGIFIALGIMLYLSAKRFIIGAEVAAAIEEYNNEPGAGGPIRTPVGGAVEYVRAVAAFATSVAAAGLIALWIPASNDPFTAPLILIAIIIMVGYAIWRKGELQWPKVVRFVMWVTLVISLIRVFVPAVADAWLQEVPEAAVNWFTSYGKKVASGKFSFGDLQPPQLNRTSPQTSDGDRIIHHAVHIRQADGWRDVQELFPACTNYSLNRRGDERVSIRFTDGSVATIEDPSGRWGVRRPQAFRVDTGEAIVDIWLTDVGRDCGRKT